MSFDVIACRRLFPGLDQTVHGVPLVYLDNAATSQKPKVVLEAVARAYRDDCANVHRGVHALSARATEAFERVRETARRFLNAKSEKEIIFTSGTTDAVNLVAQTYARSILRPGDEVLLTELEHHSNIVPWQLICEEKGASIKVVPLDDRGELRIETLDDLLSPKLRIMSMAHVSNSLGTINPIGEIVRRARARGVTTFVDGAQAAPHIPIDVSELGCDFYAFSSHKVFGPTGVGVLYGKKEILDAMPPWRGGGDMIERVTFAKTTFAAPPQRFEAGTPHIAGVIGLGAALEWVMTWDRRAVETHEGNILAAATNRLRRIPGIQIHGTAAEKVPLISFTLGGASTQDIGTLLDQQGIAVRTGHHCAQPVMEKLGVPATARASFALYNTPEEVETLGRAVERAARMLG